MIWRYISFFLNKNEVSSVEVFQKFMKYRVDSNIRFLWIIIRGQSLSCIFEIKILNVLRNVHDNDNHWGKKEILFKLRSFVYWPNQSEDVSRYITECVKCVCHESVMRSQSFHFIKVIHFFQLMRMNYIKSLFKIINENIHILHIIDYFMRFFFIYACLLTRSENIIRCLKILFVLYKLFKTFYIDSKIHFDAEEIRNFLRARGVKINYSLFEFFGSTGVVKIKNRLLEQMLRKKNIEWNTVFASFILQLNFKIIDHFHMFSFEIFLEIPFHLEFVDFTLTHLSERIITS